MKVDMNQKFAEVARVCWHEDMSEYGKPSGAQLCRHCGQMFAGDHVRNPDYAADPRLVLREMERIGKLFLFLDWLVSNSHLTTHSLTKDYILDTTGKLRDAAIEFMEKQIKNEEQIAALEGALERIAKSDDPISEFTQFDTKDVEGAALSHTRLIARAALREARRRRTP